MCPQNRLKVRIVSIMSFVVAMITVIKMSMELRGEKGSGKYAILLGLDVREFFPGSNEMDITKIFTSSEEKSQVKHFVLFCLSYAIIDATCCIFLFFGSIKMNFLTMPPYILIKGLSTIIQFVAFMYYVIEGNYVKAEVVIHALTNFVLTVICIVLVVDGAKNWSCTSQVPYRRAVNEDDGTEMVHFTQATEADGSPPIEVMETANVGAEEPTEALVEVAETVEVAAQGTENIEQLPECVLTLKETGEGEKSLLVKTESPKHEEQEMKRKNENYASNTIETLASVHAVPADNIIPLIPDAESVMVALADDIPPLITDENSESSYEDKQCKENDAGSVIVAPADDISLISDESSESSNEDKQCNENDAESVMVVPADDMIPLISDESSESSNEDKQCEENAARQLTADGVDGSSETVEDKAKKQTEKDNVTNEEVETSFKDFGVAELPSSPRSEDEDETAV